MREIMGFIWPLMAASAEAMMWFGIILVLVIIGRGKILPSEKPIFIDRTGQYKIKLAPGLNLVQPFIEFLARQIVLHEGTVRNGPEFIFKVRDKNIASRKMSFYLLGISVQNGYLYFEAGPAPAEPVPSRTPPPESVSQLDVFNNVESAIHRAAKLWSVELHRIK